MGIHIRQRDKVSTRASAEMRGVTARKVVEAVAAGTTGLQSVMNRDSNYPADATAALAAVASLRQNQAAVDAAVGELLAWLQVGGITRHAMAQALGVRPETIRRLIAPHAEIAAARHVDLNRDDAGAWAWSARRLDRLPDAEG